MERHQAAQQTILARNTVDVDRLPLPLYCLAASARGDARMIAIIMGASSEGRADAALALLSYGFRFYE